MTGRPGEPTAHPGETPSVGEVVLVAAGLEDAERQTYLDDIAARAPEVAERARQRLTAAESLNDSFLATPAAEMLDIGEADEAAPGDPLATADPEQRYEVGELLGQGGMGRVHVAFDHQLGRSVALKFLTHKDPEVLRLFLQEARALARIEHPNVLEVYDSGRLGDKPYLAMRYVAGGTLAEVAPTLPLEERVRLMVQVAEGLHAAHRQGLLHRDVKPANVLVHRTEDGLLEALVTDFGLATPLEAEDVPEAMGPSTALAGSSHYIAPERLAEGGSPDRRSDVYSLGVTLYRVLTGSLPWDGQPTLGILRQTVEADLPAPRERAPELPVELEAILLRATARDPAQRYSSARAVATDLQRYLDGEVVEAHAAGLAYRLTRFVLRHKALATLAALLLVVLGVSAVAVSAFALRADDALNRLQTRQNQAEELIRFLVVDLHDTLQSVGRLDVLDSVGTAAADYFAAVPPEELSEDELLRRSRMLYQLGDVRIRRGNLQEALEPMEVSRDLARRLVERQPEDGERLFELGQSHFWVGYVHWQRGDLAAARGPFEDYLAVSRQLVARDPDHRGWRQELSYAHSNLGSLLQAEGAFDEALEQFRTALDLDQALVAEEPTVGGRSELAATHNTVGMVLLSLGRLREAEASLMADLELRQTLVSEDPDNPRWRELLGTSHSHVGNYRLLRGERMAAAEHFGAMLGLTEALVAHDPDNSAWRFQLAWAHLDLGRVALGRGETETAETSIRQALTELDGLLALDATPLDWRRARGVALQHLGRAMAARQGEVSERAVAEAVTEATAVLESIATERPSDREAHRWLAWSHLLRAELAVGEEGARAACGQAVSVLEPWAAAGHDGRLLAPWAAAQTCLGSLDQARETSDELRAAGYDEPTPWTPR